MQDLSLQHQESIQYTFCEGGGGGGGGSVCVHEHIEFFLQKINCKRQSAIAINKFQN